MITISTFAAMTLLYVLFSKVVPIISIWEMKAGQHPAHASSEAVAHDAVLGETRA
jgi:hypothetical protein